MDWSNIPAFLTDEKTWAIVAAVSGAVAAIAALRSINLTVSEQKELRESQRPYITIVAPGIKPLSQSPPYRIQITMENIGVHPVEDLYGKIIIIDKNLKGEPQFVFGISVANEIPTKTPTPWYNDGLNLPTNVAPQYIVLAISYIDPILNKSHRQTFFMKWDGVVNGQTSPDFVHVSKDEKQKIEEHLKIVLKDFI